MNFIMETPQINEILLNSTLGLSDRRIILGDKASHQGLLLFSTLSMAREYCLLQIQNTDNRYNNTLQVIESKMEKLKDTCTEICKN